MTAAVILISFLASVALYITTAWDGYLFGITFYVAVFFLGLASATIFAALSRDRRCILAAVVLWLNFIGSHIAWAIGDPNLYAMGVMDVLTLAYFAWFGRERWELVIGFLYFASLSLGFLSFIGVIPGAEDRIASGFIVFSYPDLSSLLGHVANAVLGLAAGDWGLRIRTRARVPVRWRTA
jgi:hypothetical protein